MTTVLRAYTCHPEAETPRDLTIANCVTQTSGNHPTIGRSLTFVRDDNPRRLFAPLKSGIADACYNRSHIFTDAPSLPAPYIFT